LLASLIDIINLIVEVMTFEFHKVIKKSADSIRTIVKSDE
jgi:hypothetical protein